MQVCQRWRNDGNVEQDYVHIVECQEGLGSVEWHFGVKHNALKTRRLHYVIAVTSDSEVADMRGCDTFLSIESGEKRAGHSLQNKPKKSVTQGNNGQTKVGNNMKPEIRT